MEELLLLGENFVGSLPHLRLCGVEDLIRETVPDLRVRCLDAGGKLSLSFDLVHRHLRFSPARRTLIAGNDEVVIGALEAFEECGRSGCCAAVAFGGTAQARLNLRLPGSRLIACMAFFPERYGDTLILLSLEILHKIPVPQAVHPEPHIVTKDNVDKFYPADKLGMG